MSETVPTWYQDTELTEARTRMREAHTALSAIEAQDTPEAARARDEAYEAERAFTALMTNLAGTGGRAGFQTHDVVIDAHGMWWMRTLPSQVDEGYAWIHPWTTRYNQHLTFEEAAQPNERPTRPLILVERNGNPVGGVVPTEN